MNRITKYLLIGLLLLFPVIAMSQAAGGYVKPKTQPKSVQTISSKSKPKSFDPQLCPNANHPHMIDLGLPSGTKWACCNVGATQPENYGGYYAWGETQTKRRYDWSTYKYGESRQKCQNIGRNISGTSYDVAHVRWGGEWQMPSMTQLDELLGFTSYSFTTKNGVKGGLFTASNGNAIFIPAGGDYDGGTIYGKEEYIDIWSSSLYEGKVSPDYDFCGAHRQGFQESSYVDDIRHTFSYRCDGTNVRPVVGSGNYKWTIGSNRDMHLCPDDNHPHLIDLGLPSGTKWSCCNVNASKPEDYGALFAWGETKSKTVYDWDTYRWASGYGKLRKYNAKSSQGIVDNLKYLEPMDDVAHVNWGSGWKIASNDEMEELIKYTNSIWAVLNGINGRRFISKVNGNSIFLPATFNDNSGHKEYGYYWTSSIASDPNHSFYLKFSGNVRITGDYRSKGMSIRPVKR